MESSDSISLLVVSNPLISTLARGTYDDSSSSSASRSIDSYGLNSFYSSSFLAFSLTASISREGPSESKNSAKSFRGGESIASGGKRL